MKLEDRIKLLIQLLKSRGIQFEKGLTNEELITVEANFDITFPPDLQTLYYRYLQPIITQYFIDNKSEIWLLFLIAHSKR